MMFCVGCQEKPLCLVGGDMVKVCEGIPLDDIRKMWNKVTSYSFEIQVVRFQYLLQVRKV